MSTRLPQRDKVVLCAIFKRGLARCCNLCNILGMKSKSLSSELLAEHLKPRGKKAELAKALEVHPALVTRWVKKRVPGERVLDVERHTGVPRTEIRSDLYPASPPSPKEEAAAQ